MSARLLVGDVREQLAQIAAGSIDAVITSPPFLAQRNYGTDGDREIGREPAPHIYLDTLLELTAQFRRVLAPHGSIAVELGDTYAGSGGSGGDYQKGGWREGQNAYEGSAKRKGMRAYWPDDKSLCLVPTLYPACLAYGNNLLSGLESPAGRWRVRNVIVWHRPNPAVGELADKVRPATSYITVACIGRKRYFDLYGISHIAARASEYDEDKTWAPPTDYWTDDYSGHDVINNPTSTYRGSHFATWPKPLARRLVDMVTPYRVCQECGKPSERIIKKTRVTKGKLNPEWKRARSAVSGGGDMAQSAETTYEAEGWTDCGHNAWRPGMVLDPFSGSGTTLEVATGTGRNATGIELYVDNAYLHRERIGMFLEDDYG